MRWLWPELKVASCAGLFGGARRYKTSYLSEKWLKEPFEIEYPVRSEKSEKVLQELTRKLFRELGPLGPLGPTDPAVGIDLIPDPLEIADHRHDFDKFVLPNYVHGKPDYLTGFDLYKRQIRPRAKARKLWNQVDDTVKQEFEDNVTNRYLYLHQLRIWQGYEIVEYLKRHDPQLLFNPYPYLGLYPWEIIKEKLRRKGQIEEFEKDYYDVLINEAFGRNSRRSALQIFYTDLKHRNPSNQFRYPQVWRAFEALSPRDKNFYQTQELKHKKHADMVREKLYKQATPFANFLSQWKASDRTDTNLNPANNSPIVKQLQDRKHWLQQAGAAWKALPTAERQKYTSSASSAPNTLLYKENLLDWKVHIVMNYIFNVGGVVGLKIDDFDWKKDMVEKTRGYRYLDRMYVSTFLYIEGGKLVVASP